MITIVFPREHKKWLASNQLLFKYKQRRMWWCSRRVFWFLNDWGAIQLNLQTSRYFTNVQPLPWVDGKWRISYTFLRFLLLLLLLFWVSKRFHPHQQIVETSTGSLSADATTGSQDKRSVRGIFSAAVMLINICIEWRHCVPMDQ